MADNNFIMGAPAQDVSQMFGLNAPGFLGGAAAPAVDIWELVSRKTGTGSSGSIEWTGLDGDTDKMYRLTGRQVCTADGRCELQLNSSFLNQDTRAYRENPAGSWGLLTAIDGVLRATSTEACIVDVLIYADSHGDNRSWESRSGELVATNPRLYTGAHRWDDTGNNLTSIELTTNVPASIFHGTATELWLYKLANP